MTTMELTFEEMKKKIVDEGGLFYQYRPCRRDVATIYDIENIRHGVVYAQTPLNMNDPFDSMVGFSVEKIYDNCISMIISAMRFEDKNIEMMVYQLIKYKALGNFGELIVKLNELKSYLQKSRICMHQTKIPFFMFAQQNAKGLYSKCPKELKKFFTKDVFVAFSIIVGGMEKIDITEENLKEMYKLDNVLEELNGRIIEVRDTQYVPLLRTLLSKLTVSCFSSSGWNNQLMWAHYANSYSGICIEYDFSKIEEFIGFIYPVEYNKFRPTLSLQDLGIEKIVIDNEIKYEHSEPNMASVFSYLLCKNVCWEYEKEWRIINIGQENTPKFIELPFVKSITLGENIDPICKYLLRDVCREKGIECYEIKISTEDFTLDRRLCNEENFSYNADTEIEYLEVLIQQINKAGERMEQMGKIFDKKDKDFSQMRPMLECATEILADSYYLKTSMNRICDNLTDEESTEDAPNQVLDVIIEVDAFVAQTKENILSLQESVPNLHLAGLLNGKDYDVVKKQLNDLQELIDKYEQIKWNQILLKDN